MTPCELNRFRIVKLIGSADCCSVQSRAGHHLNYISFPGQRFQRPLTGKVEHGLLLGSTAAVLTLSNFWTPFALPHTSPSIREVIPQ